MKKPRKFTFCKFNFDIYPKDIQQEYEKYGFSKEDRYVFLGEIINMPGHCIVASHLTGKIISGYHTENFIELSHKEI